MNSIYLIGNLTRDPENTETASGIFCCRFSIAVRRQYKNADGDYDTDFFNITAWRGLGETASKYLKKGSKVAVVGSVQTRTYEDNKGNKHNTVDIIASDIEFLTPKTAEATTEEKPKKAPAKPTQATFTDIDDGDMPF